MCLCGYWFLCFSISSELTVPTVVVLNTSNQQYFLLDREIKNTEDMVQFINSILDGTVEVSCSLLFQRMMTGDGGENSSSLILKGTVSGNWGEGRPPLYTLLLSHCGRFFMSRHCWGVEMSYKGDLGGIFGDWEVLLALESGCRDAFMCGARSCANSELS